jgi:hypothetical protein
MSRDGTWRLLPPPSPPTIGSDAMVAWVGRLGHDTPQRLPPAASSRADSPVWQLRQIMSLRLSFASSA